MLIGVIYQHIKNYQNLLSENLKIKSIGIIYQHFKIYQKILYVNLNIKLIGRKYQQYQKLSEYFIREFQDKVGWYWRYHKIKNYLKIL